MRFSRSRLITLVIIAALVNVAAGAAAAATEGVRYGGRTRYETAVLLSQSTHDVSIQEVVLVSGERYPDALSAVFAAGESTEHPILLTPTDRLDDATLAEVRRLETDRVHIVGGEAAVSRAVADRLVEEGFEVRRTAGADRYETAVNVAGSTEDFGRRAGAFLVSGINFADAVAVGPLAYKVKEPILLTTPESLHPEVRWAVDRFGYREVIIVGGDAAVSPEAQAELEQLCASRPPEQGGPCRVRRIAGATRQETAIAVADYAIAERAGEATHVNLARGDDYPDALAGSPHGGLEDAVTLLTVSPTELGESTRAWLADHADEIESVDVFGSPVAVSDEVWEEAKTAAD